MGEVFLYKCDGWGPVLRRMGFFFGKFVYLADAFEDVEILRNILYSGVWSRVETIKQKRLESMEKNDDGSL